MSGPILLALVVAAASLPWVLQRPGPPRAPRRAQRRPVPVPGTDPAVLLDLLDVALMSGTSVPGALVALGTAVRPDPLAEHLRGTGTSLRLGADWAEAWQRCPAQLHPLAAALEPAWTDGVDPSSLVRQAATAIRARRRRDALEAAAHLGSRLVLPLGLCFLPAFVLVTMVPVLLSGVGSLLGP